MFVNCQHVHHTDCSLQLYWVRPVRSLLDIFNTCNYELLKHVAFFKVVFDVLITYYKVNTCWTSLMTLKSGEFLITHRTNWHSALLAVIICGVARSLQGGFVCRMQSAKCALADAAVGIVSDGPSKILLNNMFYVEFPVISEHNTCSCIAHEQLPNYIKGKTENGVRLHHYQNRPLATHMNKHSRISPWHPLN